MENTAKQYDIIIIGAGPAGISAGIYGVSRGKKVLVIEKEKIGQEEFESLFSKQASDPC